MTKQKDYKWLMSKEEAKQCIQENRKLKKWNDLLFSGLMVYLDQLKNLRSQLKVAMKVLDSYATVEKARDGSPWAVSALKEIQRLARDYKKGK